MAAGAVLEEHLVLLNKVFEEVALLILFETVRQNLNVIVVDGGVLGEGERKHIR